MLIEIHMIQNHSPANLNRDDLGAPKTCYFGGHLRNRISSQCIKRSIRMSTEFDSLRGGIRTRRLAELIQIEIGDKEQLKRAVAVLEKCGIKASKGKSSSDMLVFTTHDAIKQIALLFQDRDLDDEILIERVKEHIEHNTKSPDIALCGRMLETKELKDTTVEAALQVAHAISTHEARPEIDYYVAVDDIKGDDAGAGFVDESMFASACFYKYFSIHWEQLVANLAGNEELAAKTLATFLTASARTNPSGKQNSFAAHNYPDGILIEIKSTPVSYANAFTAPVEPHGEADLVTRSIGRLANYVQDMRIGYFEGEDIFTLWFSPNGRIDFKPRSGDIPMERIQSLNALRDALLKRLGYEWDKIKDMNVVS